MNYLQEARTPQATPSRRRETRHRPLETRNVFSKKKRDPKPPSAENADAAVASQRRTGRDQMVREQRPRLGSPVVDLDLRRHPSRRVVQPRDGSPSSPGRAAGDRFSSARREDRAILEDVRLWAPLHPSGKHPPGYPSLGGAASGGCGARRAAIRYHVEAGLPNARCRARRVLDLANKSTRASGDSGNCADRLKPMRFANPAIEIKRPRTRPNSGRF